MKMYLGFNKNKINLEITILFFLVALSDFVFGALYVDYMISINMQPVVIGFAFFFAFLMSTLVEIPSGDWGDRWGQRRVAFLGLLIWGFSLILISIFSKYIEIVVLALCLWSIGQALYSGAPISLAINTLPSEQVKERSNLVRISTISKWFGSASGALFVLFGFGSISSSTLILISGLTLIFLSIWMVLCWPESKKTDPQNGFKSIVKRLKLNWDIKLNPLVLININSSFILSVILISWQPLLGEDANYLTSYNGLILFFMTLGAALGAFLTKYEYGGVPWMVVLSFVNCSLLFMLSISRSLQIKIAFLFLAEILLSYTMTLVAIKAHSLFADSFRNLFWSLFSAFAGISMAAADALFGVFWQVFGLYNALMFCSFFSILIIFVYFVFRTTRGPVSAQE